MRHRLNRQSPISSATVWLAAEARLEEALLMLLALGDCAAERETRSRSRHMTRRRERSLSSLKAADGTQGPLEVS